MRSIDLNADLGEYSDPDAQACENEILKYISSCNIACGGHAGDAETIRQTIKAAIINDVKSGAHPSYPDRDGFGRRSLKISLEELETSVVEQLQRFQSIASECAIVCHHVKAHGALYNEAMTNREIAACLLKAVSQVFPSTKIVGLPGSILEELVITSEHTFISEGFIDRRYTNDGFLVSREIIGSIIETTEGRVQQAACLALGDDIMSNDGQVLSVRAQTLCLHGDDHAAVETAKRVYAHLSYLPIKLEAY